jgi:cyclic lactone autoinducer peptide
LSRRLARAGEPWRATRWQRLVFAGALAGAAALVAVAIANAVSYHATYEPEDDHGKT